MMKEYELILEIPNSCSGNQMRDVFFAEVECESPLEYVKSQHPEKEIEISSDVKTDGSVIIYAEIQGVIYKYMFTPI